MKQQINLLQGIVRQDQNRNALNLYSGGIITSILLLAGISFYSVWSLSNLKTQVEQVRLNLGSEEARVNNLLSKFPKQENDSGSASQITLRQNKVSELSRTLQLLNEQTSDTQQGFSQYFQALANQSIPDIWLSKIYIIGPRRIVNLEGSTFKSEQIPYFLQQLQKEPIFHGQTFARLNMLKSEKTTGQIDFKLNTTTDPRDNDEHD
jgi:hypothetical protein